jgi:DNA-binding MarR family transcriptional regulator
MVVMSGKERRLRGTGVRAWLRLARIYHKFDRATAAHLRRWGLSVAQFDVLAQVGSHPGLTQKDLARALLVTKGNVCQVLDRMEADGLIGRRREGRAKRLDLTERGAALFAEVVPAQEAWIEQQFGVLDPIARDALLVLLRQLDRSSIQ